MRCRATKQADGRFVINGKKSWITSGPVAKYIVLFAMTDPEKSARGITAFVVDTDKPGFHRGKTEPKLGIRASATCEIEFTDYVAEADEVLGQEGHGFKIAMGVLDAGRIGIASQAIGIGRAAYEATLAYVRERKAFGQPIGAFQMTQAKIADMKCKLDASTLLTLRAAWVKGQGERFTNEAAIANDRVGGVHVDRPPGRADPRRHGLFEGMPIERYFRDAKITEIYEGTSEIQRAGHRPQRNRPALTRTATTGSRAPMSTRPKSVKAAKRRPPPSRRLRNPPLFPRARRPGVTSPSRVST